MGYRAGAFLDESLSPFADSLGQQVTELPGDSAFCLGSDSILCRGYSKRLLGMDAYRLGDQLSYLEIGGRVAGESTADLAGSNHGSQHLLRVLPDGRHVLFDQIGPGLVTFLRMQ